MEKYKPPLSSGHKYNGFKLDERGLIFTKAAKEEIREWERIAIYYDLKQNAVKLVRGGEIVQPKGEKLVTPLASVGLPKGRYYKIANPKIGNEDVEKYYEYGN